MAAGAAHAEDYPSRPIRAGTPRDVVDKLSRAVREAVKPSEVVAAWRPHGVDPLDGGPDDLARLAATELKRWSDVATAAGLKK